MSNNKKVIWQDDIDKLIKDNEDDTFKSLLVALKKNKELEKQNEELINMLTIVCKMIDINKWYPGALKGIKPLLEKIKQKTIEEILEDAEGKLFKKEDV